MRTHTPRDADEAREIVAAAHGTAERFHIVGGGRCCDFGRPVLADSILDLSSLRGVSVYEPQELVLTARAATPLAEINALLREHRQHLAFEPPDLGPLWGRDGGGGTLGGCLMLGFGGPRRATAGAPRDHFLGLKGINGHAQPFAAGGRVVKNVTGFDLPKLFAGSLGTLGVLTEVTVKVLPLPQRTLTLALPGLAAAEALALLARVAGSPAQVTGGAHLPEGIAAASALPLLKGARRSFTLMRLEGFAPSVEWSARHLEELVRNHSSELPLHLEPEDSARIWGELGSASYFADGSTTPVWRVAVEPSRAAAVAAEIESRTGASCYFDCFGGVIWVRMTQSAAGDAVGGDDAGESVVRGALGAGLGALPIRASGHATLVRASSRLRERIPPYQPLEPGLAALTRRVKQQFDPLGLFNPGRMYPGV